MRIVTRPPSDFRSWARIGITAFPARRIGGALLVAKPGAHILAFGGTRTYHRLACAIEDAGWEVAIA